MTKARSMTVHITSHDGVGATLLVPAVLAADEGPQLIQFEAAGADAN